MNKRQVPLYLSRDHTLYAQAITAGVIRWEWLGKGPHTLGEIIVNGFRWACYLDSHGVPELSDNLREEIASALKDSERTT